MRDDHLIRIPESRSQVVLKNTAPCAVAAWLKHCPKATTRIARFHRFERFANGGGMMGKIVNHCHATLFAAHFHSSFDAFKGIEARLDL